MSLSRPPAWELPAARLDPYPPPDAPTRPLSGVRVLDLTTAVAGPVASLLLGALGAEVLRIETPWARPRQPASALDPIPGAPDQPWNREPRLNELANSKRSVALNLATPEGRGIFLDLVAVSDVVIENYSPRVMGNFDLEWDALEQCNPRIIYVAMPAFGKSGPWRDRISYGPGIDAMSGLAWLTGYADADPLKPGNFYCDQNAGLHAALATVAALRARTAEGGGQTVELAMLEGELQLIGEALLGAQLTGREPTRIGNEHPAHAPHNVYPARPRPDDPDAWIAIACRSDKDWRALRSLWTDPRADRREFATALRRWKHRDRLDALIADWTGDHDAVELAQQLQSAGVPASAVMGARTLLRDPQVAARQSVGALAHPQLGPSPAPQAAWRLSDTPSPPKNAAPLFAVDTRPVLSQLLGYSDQQIDDLIASGAAADRLIERH